MLRGPRRPRGNAGPSGPDGWVPGNGRGMPRHRFRRLSVYLRSERFPRVRATARAAWPKTLSPSFAGGSTVARTGGHEHAVWPTHGHRGWSRWRSPWSSRARVRASGASLPVRSLRDLLVLFEGAVRPVVSEVRLRRRVSAFVVSAGGRRNTSARREVASSSRTQSDQAGASTASQAVSDRRPNGTMAA